MRAADGDEEPADAASGSPRVWPEIEALRAAAGRLAAAQAEQLRVAFTLVTRCEAEARLMLSYWRRVPGQPCDDFVIASEVSIELMAGLGISKYDAGELADLAVRLTRVLPSSLAALTSGRLDLPRAKALADLTRVLDDAAARQVEADLLDRAGDAPWDCPSPRAWKSRVYRAVVQADADAFRRRREESLAERAVRSWPNGDGTSDLRARGSDEDVIMADQVINDLARAWAAVGPDGQPLTLDQRRSDAFFDVFRRIRDGQPLPTAPVRREREIGLVLNADTLFGAGPAAQDPGERRGNGAPGPVDPTTAHEEARSAAARGAGVCVLLTDAHGVLLRVLRLPGAPPGGWTRAAVEASVRAMLSDLPPLRTDSYAPTAPIVEHVHARNPRCTSYDCPRAAKRCDLDHDTPWPRGPTDVTNLAPRCRHDHEPKTRGLVRTALHPDGSVTTRLVSGVTFTTRPEALPGFGSREGYGPQPLGAGYKSVRRRRVSPAASWRARVAWRSSRR